MTTKNRAIVLYGSVARGDDDASSDLDILVVGMSPELPNAVRSLLREDLPLNVSHYTWDEFFSMRTTGSLFLRHLAQEAKPLHFDGDGMKRYERALCNLPSYQHADRDICGFRLGLNDIRGGLASYSPPLFEMSVLGGIARHASVLACYLKRDPVFSRTSIQHSCDLFGIPQLSGKLVAAHKYRQFVHGQCPRPREVSRMEAGAATAACARLINAMESYA